MCIVTFRALCTMSVLVAAKYAANAVAQDCKVLSRPSKCVLIFWVQMSNLGSLCCE